MISFFEPWVSAEDIHRGARWVKDIGQELEGTNVGIVCLTPENLTAPWINFEAGALSKELGRGYVCTYLFGVSESALEGPLVQFQATRANKDGTYRLLRTLNNLLGDLKRSDSQLERLYEVWWPALERALRAVPAVQRSHLGKRDEGSMLEELLDLTRQQSKSSAASLVDQMLDTIDFSNLLQGADLDQFRALTELDGFSSDQNVSSWAENMSLIDESKAIDGLWASRWNNFGALNEWTVGSARLITQGRYFVALHSDPKYDFLLLGRREGEEWLVGRHFNLVNMRDRSMWVGRIINAKRVDGRYSQGRWDLRR